MLRTMLLASLIAFLAGGSGAARAAVYQVPGDFASIQEAIDAAADGDTIFVGPGTWSRIHFLGKRLEVRSTNGPDATTLLGNGAGPVVRMLLGEPAGTLLEGFTVTGGLGKTKGGRSYGGGILGADTSATIRDCKILGNTALSGGGIAFYRGNPVIEDCEVTENSGEEGRGIWLREGNPIVRRCEIHLNATIDNSSIGGGIYVEDAAFLIEGSEIHSHVFDREESWLFQSGGGIAVVGSSSGTILDNLVYANRGCSGAGIQILADGIVLVRGNEIRDNDANCGDIGFGPGAGIQAEGPEIRLDRNVITGNRYGWPGGGIHASADVVIVSNYVYGNSAIHHAGGIEGGGILTNNTVVFNSVLPSLGGETESLGIRSNGIVTNCLVFGNNAVPGDGDQITGSATVTYSVVEGGYPGEGNIDATPILSNGGDGLTRLPLGSVAVDAGTLLAPELPTVDFDGDDRVQDGDGDGNALVDIGADELRREEAVLFGNHDNGPLLVPVLHVNGSVGDPMRRVTLEGGDDVVLEIDQAIGSSNGRYVVHGNLGAPDLSDLTVLPRGIGTIGFPLILPQATPSIVLNTLGKTDRIGENAYFGQSLPTPPLAPATLLDLPGGDATNLPPGTTLTFQGVIHVGSLVDFAVTNGVVLVVE